MVLEKSDGSDLNTASGATKSSSPTSSEQGSTRRKGTGEGRSAAPARASDSGAGSQLAENGGGHTKLAVWLSLAPLGCKRCVNVSKPRILIERRQSCATPSDFGWANHRLSALIVYRADLVNNASVCKKEGGSKERTLYVKNSPDVMADGVVIEDVPATRCSLRGSRFRQSRLY